jgi:hypothetical protein
MQILMVQYIGLIILPTATQINGERILVNDVNPSEIEGGYAASVR